MKLRKLTIVFAFVALLVALVAGSAFADGHLTRYDDTESSSNLSSGGASLICNGDFHPDHWGESVEMLAECWKGYDNDKAGWESRYANVNMAEVHDTAGEFGRNDALGMFVRNVGGSGPHLMYATNALTDVTRAGDYWVQVHGTMWGEFFFFMAGPNSAFVENGMIANSVAFYAISSESDATMVESSEWRELFVTDYRGPKEPGVIPCPNGVQECAQVGRYERVTIEPGQYLHLAAGMKFDTFNVWTAFEFDDISINAIEGEAEDLSGIYQNKWRYDGSDYTNGSKFFDGDVSWDRNAPR